MTNTHTQRAATTIPRNRLDGTTGAVDMFCADSAVSLMGKIIMTVSVASRYFTAAEAA